MFWRHIIKYLNYFLLSFFVGLIYFYLYTEKSTRIKELKTTIKTVQDYQLKSSIDSFKDKTELIISTLVQKDKILILQKKALDAKDEKQRDIYRKKLLKELSPIYTELKKHGIKQFHFHFPDTTSFLRLHKPGKFGDNLESVRYSLVVANSKKIEVSGFEEGRMFNGYRFVYPLFYKGEHIGSVETSIGSSALNRSSTRFYKTQQYMILHKDIVQDKVFKEEMKNYEISNLNKNFYHESNTFINYKQEFDNSMDISLKDFHTINKQLSSTVTSEVLLKYERKVEFVKINSKYYYASFYPIKNVKEDYIGYIITYKKCYKYKNIISDYIEKNIVFSFAVIVMILFLYKIKRAKDKLAEYNKIANEQRDLALKATKAKSEFLANMSHEIRTPLNAILGFIEILRKENKGRSTLKYINIVADSSQNLLQIIEDILDFSKIESGKLEIDKVDFNTIKEFEIITHLFEAKCSQKDISLILHIDKNIPKYINTDPLRVKQIISNFISNAVKFTDNGKKITIEIGYEEGMLNVSVKDQGKGISKDKLENIFNAFEQEDSSTTRRFGGTGLGLSISKELAELLGGEIGVKSELGKGSEFYISIPADIGNEAYVEEDIEDKIENISGNVLVVEDNKTNQQYMQIVLDEIGLSCDMANDGLEAIEKFKQNKYDLILMDENMPNMGGIEATKEIVKYENTHNLEHTPIVALTANALKGDREKFLNAGMDEYLSKPLDVNKLGAIIRKIMS